jgi:hypothetical protein
MDLTKFDILLIEDDEDDTDEIVMDKMFDLIVSLSDENLSDEQADKISEIIDMVDPDDVPDEILDMVDDEAVSEVFKKRVKRDLKAARQRRREYRSKRSKMRLKAKRYRRSASGKMTLRKAKRYKKFGKTSTMKRQRKFVGPSLSRLK